MGAETGAVVLLHGPYPFPERLQTKRTIPVEEFLLEWEYLEPSMPSVQAIIDELMSELIPKLQDETEDEATSWLHTMMGRPELLGRFPTWMPPSFWKVEFHVVPTQTRGKVVIHGKQYTAVPASLSGKNLEFFPLDGDRVKAQIRGDKLFIVSDTIFEAIIGLARLVEARGN